MNDIEHTPSVICFFHIHVCRFRNDEWWRTL